MKLNSGDVAKNVKIFDLTETGDCVPDSLRLG